MDFATLLPGKMYQGIKIVMARYHDTEEGVEIFLEGDENTPIHISILEAKQLLKT